MGKENDRVFVDVNCWFGEYNLSVIPGEGESMWLSHVDGEGMEIGVKEVELILKKYFEENF